MRTHLITLCLLLTVSLANAQDNQWKHYTNTTTPNCMIADGQYLWIGTNAGLVKFDRITDQYEVFHSSTAGFQMNAIVALTRDKEGGIWVGTRGAGVARLQNGKWTQFTPEDHDFGNGVVWAMACDSAGNVWLGSDAGLFRYSDEKFTTITKTTAPFVDNTIYKIAADREGGIWVATKATNSTAIDQASILHFDGANWTLHNDALDEGYPSLMSVFAIYPARNGDVWFGFEGKVARLRGRSWDTYNSMPGYGPYVYVFSMAEDVNGTMYMTTPSGISRFDGLSWDTVPNYPLGSAKSIVAIEDEMWFAGYERDGIAKFKNGSWQSFTDLSNSVMMDNHIEAMTIDSRGTLWFAFGRREVVSYDGMSWKTHHFMDAPVDMVFALAADSSGNLWLGTTMNGIVKWDGSTTTRYRRSNSPIITDKVMAIAYDKQRDAIWFGGRFDQKSDSAYKGAVTFFDGTNWRNFHPGNSGLPWGEFDDIEIAPNGDIWFAMPYMGAARYDGVDTWSTYNKSNSSIPDDYVSSLATSTDGAVWLTTNAGAARYQDGAWASFTQTNSQIGSNGLTDVTIDADGDIWFSAFSTENGGLVRYSNGNWTHYGVTNSPVGSMLVSRIISDNHGNNYGGTYDAGVVMFNENGIAGPLSVLNTKDMKHPDIYPNPASTSVELVLPAECQLVRVIDVLGRERLRLTTSGAEKVTLDVSSLDNGNYFLVTRSAETVNSTPLSIVR